MPKQFFISLSDISLLGVYGGVGVGGYVHVCVRAG